MAVSRFLAVVCGLCVLSATSALAQPTPADPQRPKLGLVLSGGGAMGIAHIGVIQELERLGIRPDVVVGTSMGSIVGGLYAAGLNGAELQTAVQTMNWDAIFDATPPRDGLTYRQKRQQADFPVKASIGVVKGNVRQPDALVSDANLLLQLRRILGARAAVDHFDKLPIPFRAVATDIETGQKVVLEKGELAGAMRASMSVPGVFAPYQIGDKRLVDGGMADNVPIDVAREMGAEVLIVVATQSPLAKGEEVQSVGQVLGQTVTLLILANERQQLSTLKPTDVLIPVYPGELTAGDFKKGAAFIAVGHKAALTKEADLQRIASGRGPARMVATAKPTPTIDYVRVENDSKIADKVLLREVDDLVGKPLDTDRVVAALQGIQAIGVFTRVDFTIEQRDGKTGLVIDAQQRPGDANRIRPGVTIAATDEGRSTIDLSIDYRLLQLDSYGSEARFVAVLGSRKEFSAEYFKVFDSHQRWFVAPSIDLQGRLIPVYNSNGRRLGEYDAKYGEVGLAAGRQFGGFGEIRAGIFRGEGTAEVEEGFLSPDDINLDSGRVFVSGGIDTLDSPYFPTRGVFLQALWNYGMRDLGDVSTYQQSSAFGSIALSSGPNTVLLTAEGGDTHAGRAPVSRLFNLGGPFSFPGFAVDELTGETYVAGRAMYRRRLNFDNQGLFGIPLYAGATVVAGNTFARHGDFDWDDMRIGGSVFVAADTTIGPVFVSFGAADEGRYGFYVFVGRPF